jgi:hypothetical protein
MNKDDLELVLKEIIKYFGAQLTLLKGSTVEIKLNGKKREVIILLTSACNTGTAMCELGNNYQYFYIETLMLARSFIEKVINYFYLQICDEKEYIRFFLHPFYRTFHLLQQEKKAGGNRIKLSFSGIEKYKSNKQVEEALKIFSETNPKLKWSEKSIAEKLDCIAKNLKITVGLFLLDLFIYPIASEALHGSLYGCAQHTGVFNPTVDHANKEEVDINILKELILLYAQLGSTIYEAIKYLSEQNEKKFVEASAKNEKLALEIMKIVYK